MKGGKQIPKVGDLEIDQELKFQRKMWGVEKFTHVLIASILLAGLLGIWGGGPFSSRELSSVSGRLRLNYDRFLRNGSPALLKMTISPAEGQDASFWIDRKYLEEMELHEILPEPERTDAKTDRITYYFPKVSEGPFEAILRVSPRGFGFKSGRVGFEKEALSFRQIVYP